MTKRKFYIIKTLVAIVLSVSIYFFINEFFVKNKITDERKPSDLEFGIMLFDLVFATSIFTIVIFF